MVSLLSWQGCKDRPAVSQSECDKPLGSLVPPELTLSEWTQFMKVCSGLTEDEHSAQSHTVGLGQSWF